MTKYVFLLFILLLPAKNIFSQTKIIDSIPVEQISTRSVNFGNSISVGPEYIPLYPSQYGANLNYRFWYRTVTKRIMTDNTINLSAGYARLINENLLKLKAGDLVLIKNKFRLGIFADYFRGANTKFLALDCNFGIQTYRCYFYVGGIQSLQNWGNEKGTKINISIGFDFYILNKKVYIN